MLGFHLAIICLGQREKGRNRSNKWVKRAFGKLGWQMEIYQSKPRQFYTTMYNNHIQALRNAEK